MQEPKVSIVRLEKTPEGAFGVLVLDGRLFCATLEPEEANSGRSGIPAGRYLCRRSHGTTPSNPFEILVPGRRGVRFHSGHEGNSSHPQVLLGRYSGVVNAHSAAENSVWAFKRFMAALADTREFELEFVDRFPADQSSPTTRHTSPKKSRPEDNRSKISA